MAEPATARIASSAAVAALEAQAQDLLAADTFGMRATYLREIKTIAREKDPLPSSDLEAVLVLSGRNSHYGTLCDFKPDVGMDVSDTVNRMQHGINVAREVTAKRLRKPATLLSNEEIKAHGPIIIFNGAPVQNTDLKHALAEGKISDYPPEKFEILDLPADKINTPGHFYSLKEHVERLGLKSQKCGIVTSAYHWPRSSRIPISEILGEGITFVPFLHDRGFTAPDVEKDLNDEMTKLPGYVEKKWIGEKPDTAISCSSALFK